MKNQNNLSAEKETTKLYLVSLVHDKTNVIEKN